MLLVVRWYAIETRGFHGTSSAFMVAWNMPAAHTEKYYALRGLQRFYTFHNVEVSLWRFTYNHNTQIT
jgi:hypothetical protein